MESPYLHFTFRNGNVTDNSITKDTDQFFNVQLAVRTLTWNVTCIDEFNNTGTTAEQTLTIIVCNPVFTTVNTACFVNDTFKSVQVDGLCGTPDTNATEESCNFCTGSATCNTFSGICQVENNTEKCTDPVNSCFNQTGLSSDFVDLARGCVGVYGSGEIPEVVTDNPIGIGATIFTFVALIALVILFGFIATQIFSRNGRR